MDTEKRVISPLRQLLMTVELEKLFAFLHQMKIQFVLNREANGHYNMKIFGEGILKYQAGSVLSPRSAVADAIAQFLVGEKRDFHLYQVEAQDERAREM